MPLIYSPDALVYDPLTNEWSLRPDYDPQLHRVDVTFSDDDEILGGDHTNDEVGNDDNQNAEIRDLLGNLITSGRVYDDETFELQRPDTTTFRIDRLEIGGQLVGYVTTGVLEPGISYTQMSTDDVCITGGDNRLAYSQITPIPCFLSGTEVMTAEGCMPVDWLRVGDRLLTRDAGFQPLLWVGRFEIDPADAGHAQDTTPVEIAAGALGIGQPASKLRVSPQHRVLLQDPHLQLCFGHEAMFCPAAFLCGWPGIERADAMGPVVYYHLLLPRHAAVLSDGQWTESLFLGDQTEAIVPPGVLSGLRRQADAAGMGHDVTAYPCLRRWEVSLLTPPEVQDETADLARAWTEEGARARA